MLNYKITNNTNQKKELILFKEYPLLKIEEIIYKSDELNVIEFYIDNQKKVLNPYNYRNPRLSIGSRIAGQSIPTINGIIPFLIGETIEEKENYARKILYEAQEIMNTIIIPMTYNDKRFVEIKENEYIILYILGNQILDIEFRLKESVKLNKIENDKFIFNGKKIIQSIFIN